MKINAHTATYSLFNAARSATASMQAELARLQEEVVTGVHADSGLVLGARSEELTSFKSDMTELKRLTDTNGVVASRLDMSQTVMDKLNAISDDLVNTIGLSLGDEMQRPVIVTESEAAIEEITSLLNTQVGGVHIFGGLNTGNSPIADHVGGAGEAAFNAAFTGHFGFAKTDPAAAAITGAQMTDFLENVLAPQFEGAGWAANYSGATDEVVTARIGPNVTTGASVSANEQGFRQLMLSAVVARELYSAPLSQEARDSAGLFAITKAKSGGAEITGTQARVGLIENRIEGQNKTLTGQIDVLTKLTGNLEGLDQYEITTRITQLLTQIEASYATTSRIQQMSILRYL